jgi:hypothetical protein
MVRYHFFHPWILLLANSAQWHPRQAFSSQKRLEVGRPALSPLLFILMMEPLQNILLKATELGLLSQLGLRSAKTRSSFYADDAALFLNPLKEDMIVTQRILQVFGSISGLKENLN